ncbi:Pollen-specific arabinogalacta protein BAN102 [Zea mays]|uniref:Pollen-specific arabinogalacta protein BAN102 n=2 Tax=Zea mays TaxID=4577 RepID=A0A1D6Q8V0_MAIZE|nr:Pollen-specific arabinogalacta protein BAN102 [Zea mays]
MRTCRHVAGATTWHGSPPPTPRRYKSRPRPRLRSPYYPGKRSSEQRETSSPPSHPAAAVSTVANKPPHPGMEMKKIACAVLVAASATVALAAEAPAPSPTSGSSAVAPAIVGAAVASFFAYYIH